MAAVTDRNDPGLKETLPDGQQKNYLVLSEEERAKGFIRPVRRSYRHIGIRPKYPLRELTPDEHERFKDENYVSYEKYPEEMQPICGKYWTTEELNSGCGSVTDMGQALAETYARSVTFYGATFCCQCGRHFPVGPDGQFVWVENGCDTEQRVGT